MLLAYQQRWDSILLLGCLSRVKSFQTYLASHRVTKTRGYIEELRVTHLCVFRVVAPLNRSKDSKWVRDVS